MILISKSKQYSQYQEGGNMELLVMGMRASIKELDAWEAANPDIPDVVGRAIIEYRNLMVGAIDTMQTAPFKEGEPVELSSNRYESRGYYRGDKGTVEDIRKSDLNIGYEIKVTWDTGSAADYWMPASDFSGI